MKRLAVCALVVASFTGSRDSSVIAQTTRPIPSVSVRRMPLLSRVVTGDFNGDHIVDLASTSTVITTGGPALVVALGKGDGTFGAPVSTRQNGGPLTTGDFNEDGKLDLIADLNIGSTPLFMMPGNGDGTFGTPVQIGSATEPSLTFAEVADFDGDGNDDVAVGLIGDSDDGHVLIYAGRGDGTFSEIAANLFLGTDTFPNGGVVADFNGDGQPDVAVASIAMQSVSIFLNHGAFNFSASDRPLGHPATDVAAEDVNGDGKLDLIVAQMSRVNDFEDGLLSVLPGNGDGTFAAGSSYPTAANPWRLATADMNRDGVLDIVTANRSAISIQDCGPFYKTWDSVTVLSGAGDGTFVRSSDFSIGNQHNLDSLRYRQRVFSLSAVDITGDGFKDLVVSDGAVFINNRPDPNWAPSVDAGAGGTITGHQVTLRAIADDVDQDMLRYAWSTTAGITIPPVPNPCVTVPDDGSFSFTVTVDDGQGHRSSASVAYTFTGGGTETQPKITITAPTAGSVIAAGQPFTIRWTIEPGSFHITRIDLEFTTDDEKSPRTPIAECQNLAASATSCVWNNPPASEFAHVFVNATDSASRGFGADSGRFAIRSGSVSTIGDGWAHADVGAVGAAGTATFDGFVGLGVGLTVSGSGADIWGTADEFHYAWKTMSGDFEIETRVSSLEAVNAWTKAGLMIRPDPLDPASPHASIFVTPAKGIAFQRRTADGGTSVNTSGAALVAPVWLRMVRQGGVVSAYYKKQPTNRWTLLGQQSIPAIEQRGTLAVGVAVTSHADGAVARAKFEGVYLSPVPVWTTTAIGGATGSASATNATIYTVKGSGTDIWGTSDSFNYMWVRLNDRATLTARVLSVGNTNAWAKAGLMMRSSLAPDAPQVDVVVTPGKGVAMQYRNTTAGTTVMAGQRAAASPVWIRLVRVGTFVQAMYSTEFFGVWRVVGQINNLAVGPDMYVGIAVTSHNAGVETTATFDTVRVEQ